MVALAGCVDAIGWPRLHELFVRFMSGTSTLLGLALAGQRMGRVDELALVVALFATGAAAGAAGGLWAGRWHTAVVLAMVAAAIVLWPTGNDRGADQAGDAKQQTGQPAPDTGGTGDDPTGDASESPTEDPSESAEPTASGGKAQQARALDSLLGEMAATRSELATATEGDCDQTILRRVGTQRADQLEQARGLETGALDNGAEMKSALVRALEASVESNRLYQSEGCPTEPRSADQRATSAKGEFLGYWNDVARDQGLTSRDQGGI